MNHAPHTVGRDEPAPDLDDFVADDADNDPEMENEMTTLIAPFRDELRRELFRVDMERETESLPDAAFIRYAEGMSSPDEKRRIQELIRGSYATATIAADFLKEYAPLRQLLHAKGTWRGATLYVANGIAPNVLPLYEAHLKRDPITRFCVRLARLGLMGGARRRVQSLALGGAMVATVLTCFYLFPRRAATILAPAIMRGGDNTAGTSSPAENDRFDRADVVAVMIPRLESELSSQPDNPLLMTRLARYYEASARFAATDKEKQEALTRQKLLIEQVRLLKASVPKKTQP